MRKRILLIMLAALSLTACGKTENSKNDSSETQAVDTPDKANDSTGTDIDIDAFNAEIGSYGSVKLCDYKGLKLEKTLYKVEDKDIDDEIENLLFDYTEYKEVDRASKSGDYLNLSLTASDGDEMIYDYSGTEEDSYDLCIGSEDFGAEVDKKLTGRKAGDKLSFTVKHDDDFADSSLAGKKVSYEITINTVEEAIEPELTEEFIKDTLGYSSEADMREQLKKDLEAVNSNTSEETLRENAVAAIIADSEFGDYTDEIYKLCEQSYDDSYSSYMEWFGYTSLDELYEAFGITDEVREEEILNLVYRKVAIDAIAKAEGITVSTVDFNDTLEAYAASLEYESSDALLKDYGEDSIHHWALEEKVLDLVIENAKITEIEVSDEEDEN